MAGDASFFAPFMDDYFAECDEHLVEIRRLLLELGQASPEVPPSAALEELFRRFHSIKGISGMVELREAETLAHQMESYLRALRRHEVALDPEGVDALVAGTDALERTVVARRANVAPPAIDAVMAQLARACERDAPPQPASAVTPASESDAAASRWRVSFTPSAASLAGGVTVDSVRQRLRQTGDILDVTPVVTPGGITFE